jgi:hypothetical protein
MERKRVPSEHRAFQTDCDHKVKDKGHAEQKIRDPSCEQVNKTSENENDER